MVAAVGNVIVRSEYLHAALVPQILKQFIVPRAVQALQQHDAEYDAIACTGLSGTLVAPILAYELNKPIVVLRKSGTPEKGGDRHHSRMTVEGFWGARGPNQGCDSTTDAFRYVIVDDFIGTGRTVKRIINGLSEYKPGSKCVALYVYEQRYTGNLELVQQIRTEVGFSIPIWSETVAGELYRSYGMEELWDLE